MIRSKSVRVTLSCLAVLILFVKPAHAEHGDWLLGTDGLLSAQQAPEGILYQNLWSYYHASGDSFLQTGPVKCGPRGKLCLGFNANGTGSLDLFVDQNVFSLVTPYKLLGANYGFLIDVPFAIADASGAGALEPVLSAGAGSVTLPALQRSPGATKGTIADIYFEPINLGWHFRQLECPGNFVPVGELVEAGAGGTEDGEAEVNGRGDRDGVAASGGGDRERQGDAAGVP